jgi:hypothetical protein
MTISHFRVSNTTKSTKQTPTVSALTSTCSAPEAVDLDYPYSTSPNLKTYLESLHSYLNASASPSNSPGSSFSRHNSLREENIDNMGSSEAVGLTYFAKASTEFSKTLPLIGNENAYLGDIACRCVQFIYDCCMMPITC